jgi:hypothetical protein
MKGCLNCGKLFEPKRERATFCSDLCRATFHQRKRTADKKVARAKELTFKVADLEKSERAAKLFDELLKELGPINYQPTTEQSFDGEKQDKYVQDEVGQAPKPPVYDFTGMKWLDVEKVTKFPIKDRPASISERLVWDKARRAEHEEIKVQWAARKKTP